jgi:hypothetical protein
VTPFHHLSGDSQKLIVRALSNKESASVLNLAEGSVKIPTAYEFRTEAKRLEREERMLMVRAASDGTQKHDV